MNTNLFANPQIFQAYNNDPSNAYAQALMQQGASTAPVRSPLEGLARALQGGVGGFFAGRTKERYQQQDEKYRQGLAAALQGGDVLAALQASDDPSLQQMGLEAKVRQAMEKPANSFKTLTDDEEKALGLDTAGTYQRDTTGKIDVLKQPPAGFKVGDTRQYVQGNQRITEQWDGQQWSPLGAGAAFAPPTSVNVNLPKAINAGDVKMMEIGAEAVAQGQEIMPLFGLAREAAKNFPQSGTMGTLNLFLERGKQVLGLPNNAQSGEVLQAMQTKLAPMLRMPGSGATSDMEMSLYLQGVPGLLNTQQGNIALADIGEKIVKQRMDNYRAFQNYVAENGSSVGYIPNDKPILTPEDMAVLTGGAPQAAPPQAAQPGSQPDATAPIAGAKKAPDGKWYVPDPARPGKYLQVEAP